MNVMNIQTIFWHNAHKYDISNHKMQGSTWTIFESDGEKDQCPTVIRIVWGHGSSAHITEKWPIDNWNGYIKFRENDTLKFLFY